MAVLDAGHRGPLGNSGEIAIRLSVRMRNAAARSRGPLGIEARLISAKHFLQEDQAPAVADTIAGLALSI